MDDRNWLAEIADSLIDSGCDGPDARELVRAAYERGRQAPIDWTGRSAEEVAAALRAAPVVAEPWESVKSLRLLEVRHRSEPGRLHSARCLAEVRLDGKVKPWWRLGDEGDFTAAQSLEAARAAADAALLAKGVLLMKADG